MESVHPIRRGFRFGRFELDIRAHELLKDGVRIRLQDQPFEVLAMLLEQPGEVLTRDDLRGKLWPDGTFVDFEHGLNAAVKRLRSVLGDRAENPRFVETLHRLGYRFIAPVERIQSDDPDPFEPGEVAGWNTNHTVEQERPSRKLRLAVLPFTDLGDRSAHEYFSDGLTEEMITQLGRLCANRLGVIARTSSMLVQRSAGTAREIGLALSVDYLMEGTVRREGDRVRITAQLIETRGETQLWAQSYERHLADCFLVQSEVATQIVHSLAMELLPDPRLLHGAGTRDVAAHQAYLKGRYHWNKTGGEGLIEAVAYFEQARALDPTFSAAHAAIARAHVAAADYYVQEPRVALEAGRAAAARALELDPTDSEAHLTLAEVRKAVDWDWEGAAEAYRLALAFNPSNEAAHRCYGLFLAARGHASDARSAVGRARDLDPLCLVVNTSAAWVDFLASRYDGAIETCRHTLDMDARFLPAHRLLAASLLQLGRIEEAVSTFEHAPDGRRDPVSVAWLAHLWGLHGDKTRAIDLIEGLERASRDRYVSGYHLALAHAGIGNLDRAFSWLSQACDARDPSIVYLELDPRFEPLRADPRGRRLIDRLALRK